MEEGLIEARPDDRVSWRDFEGGPADHQLDQSICGDKPFDRRELLVFEEDHKLKKPELHSISPACLSEDSASLFTPLSPDKPLSLWNYPKPVKDKKLKQPVLHIFNPESIDPLIFESPSLDCPISKPGPLIRERPDTAPSTPSAESFDRGFNTSTTYFAQLVSEPDLPLEKPGTPIFADSEEIPTRPTIFDV